jgi:hypothetical protein
MKIMKASMFIAITLVVVATPAFAGLTMTPTQGPYSAGSGGEFTAKIGAGGWPQLGYAGVTSTVVGGKIVSFKTFCIETNEYFTGNTEYTVTLNDRAIRGGEAVSDPLSVGAAWLYSTFAAGTLTGYFAGDRAAHAGELQATLWWLEDEAGDPGNLNSFRNAVLGHFGSADSAKADNNGSVDVMVMNLWTKDHAWDYAQYSDGAYKYLHQDMLVAVPLPASILLGAFAVGLVGRKLTKFV